MKKIQFTSGCPNQCKYCYEPKEMKYYDPNIPSGEEIVQILDMNILANPKHEEIMINLMEANNQSYELVCGVDYRRLNQGLCNLFHNARFKKMRWAWDYSFSDQKKHKKVLQMFLKAGYKPEELSVFILVNWKIPYVECCKKLDLLKIWNVKVNDCCFDGGYPKKIANHVVKGKLNWEWDEMKKFRKMCRKHNQMVLFKIDPELKSGVTSDNYRKPSIKSLRDFTQPSVVLSERFT